MLSLPARASPDPSPAKPGSTSSRLQISPAEQNQQSFPFHLTSTGASPHPTQHLGCLGSLPLQPSSWIFDAGDQALRQGDTGPLLQTATLVALAHLHLPRPLNSTAPTPLNTSHFLTFSKTSPAPYPVRHLDYLDRPRLNGGGSQREHTGHPRADATKNSPPPLSSFGKY